MAEALNEEKICGVGVFRIEVLGFRIYPVEYDSQK